MTERCKNTLEGVIAYTTVVAIHNAMFKDVSQDNPEVIERAEQRMAAAIATDLDWSDNKPDGRISVGLFKKKVDALAKLVPKEELGNVYEAMGRLPADTGLNTELLGQMLTPIIGKKVLDISKQANGGTCVLKSQQRRS